jgi:hypothetical protein
MTIRSTFVKCTIAAVTIAATAVVFSINDNAAAGDKHYSGYAQAAATQSTNTTGGNVTATPNTPRNEGRQTRRQR